MTGEINRVYFDIGTVAYKLNIPTSKIRYWEKFFPWIVPKYSRHGNRMYNREQFQAVAEVAYLRARDIGIKTIIKAREEGRMEALMTLLNNGEKPLLLSF